MHSLLSPKGQGPAGLQVVSGLCLWTWSAGCRTIVFLLMVSASGEAGLVACASCLVKWADACQLLGGAGSWPSGGQGHV